MSRKIGGGLLGKIGGAVDIQSLAFARLSWNDDIPPARPAPPGPSIPRPPPHPSEMQRLGHAANARLRYRRLWVYLDTAGSCQQLMDGLLFQTTDLVLAQAQKRISLVHQIGVWVFPKSFCVAQAPRVRPGRSRQPILCCCGND